MATKTEMRYCEGCGKDVEMTLEFEEFTKTPYWVCELFEHDGDWNGDYWVDLSNWEHTDYA